VSGPGLDGGPESPPNPPGARGELPHEDDRYHRQRLITWWDQARIAGARVLVIGAGALGNEILKLLALTGVGRCLVYDPDTIERTNLSRSVLFREADEGEPKAVVAARRMLELNPGIQVLGRAENVVTQAGLGVFLWADVVIAGVDNREARVFVNAACARTDRTWIDGAIEGLSGVVRAFRPSETACYECTMNETDRRLLAERRSCALLAREAVARGHVPATAVTASIVGALEVEEAIKVLHGQPALLGEGLHIHGLWADFSRVRYSRREECLGHDGAGPIAPLGAGVAEISLGALLDRAERQLGEGAELDLSRDVVLRLTCPACGKEAPGRAVLGSLRERDAACPACGVHRIVDVTATVRRDTPVDLAATPADLGLPPFDVIVARRGLTQEAWLFDADAARALGPLADASTAGGAS
jgi:molybdopterin/thiamine biosynthesis adenylyltransferase